MRFLFAIAAALNIATAYVQLSLYVKFRTPEHEDVLRLLLGYGSLAFAFVLIELMMAKL